MTRRYGARKLADLQDMLAALEQQPVGIAGGSTNNGNAGRLGEYECTDLARRPERQRLLIVKSGP